MKTVTTGIALRSKIQLNDKFDYLPSSLEFTQIYTTHSPFTNDDGDNDDYNKYINATTTIKKKFRTIENSTVCLTFFFSFRTCVFIRHVLFTSTALYKSQRTMWICEQKILAFPLGQSENQAGGMSFNSNKITAFKVNKFGLPYAFYDRTQLCLSQQLFFRDHHLLRLDYPNMEFMLVVFPLLSY